MVFATIKHCNQMWNLSASCCSTLLLHTQVFLVLRWFKNKMRTVNDFYISIESFHQTLFVCLLHRNKFTAGIHSTIHTSGSQSHFLLCPFGNCHSDMWFSWVAARQHWQYLQPLQYLFVIASFAVFFIYLNKILQQFRCRCSNPKYFYWCKLWIFPQIKQGCHKSRRATQ